MSLLKTETSVTIFLTAIMTSIGALIVSPFSLSLSFWLNDYLARPVLSIEYLELIPEIQKIENPKQEISSFIQSPFFQARMMKGRAGNANMLVVYANKDQITQEEASSILNMTSTYIKSANIWLEKLKSYSTELQSKNLSDENLRQITLNYVGITGGYMTMQETETLKKSISSQINNEIKTASENVSDATKILDKLEGVSNDKIENILLKLSVLNKGNSDGLIRAQGQITISDINVNLPVLNCSPPNKQNSQRAVRVTIADDQPAPPRSNSVGKIEKHSLKEFWYQVKNGEEFKDGFNKFAEYLRSNEKVNIHFELLDHKKNKIQKSFSISL